MVDCIPQANAPVHHSFCHVQAVLLRQVYLCCPGCSISRLTDTLLVEFAVTLSHLKDVGILKVGLSLSIAVKSFRQAVARHYVLGIFLAITPAVGLPRKPDILPQYSAALVHNLLWLRKLCEASALQCRVSNQIA